MDEFLDCGVDGGRGGRLVRLGGSVRLTRLAGGLVRNDVAGKDSVNFGPVTSNLEPVASVASRRFASARESAYFDVSSLAPEATS